MTVAVWPVSWSLLLRISKREERAHDLRGASQPARAQRIFHPTDPYIYMEKKYTFFFHAIGTQGVPFNRIHSIRLSRVHYALLYFQLFAFL